MAATLRFHSWLKRGLALATEGQADSNGIPVTGAAAIDVGLAIKGVAAEIKNRFNLRGPGDVTGMDSSQILRTEPKPNAQDFEPNFFPFVEFTSPEFPWLFTTARAGRDDRLCPWLMLVVLEKGSAFKLVNSPSGSQKVLSIASDAGALLPDIEEAFAWTHVQEIQQQTSSAPLCERIEDDPSAFLARMICPIRLEPNRSYSAFLVPTFESGRLAGLGLMAEGDVCTPAWNIRTRDLDLPFYYTWDFRTGQASFEELVKQIKPFPLGSDVGVHDLDIGEPGGGLGLEELGRSFAGQEEMLVSFKGVLSSPDVEGRTWPARHKRALQAKLDNELTKKAAKPDNDQQYKALEHDPVVAPPTYGSWQAQTDKSDSLKKDAPVYIREANLDPALRSVSGVGASVVRKHQEEFMAEAWEHARNSEAVQSELRHCRFSFLVSGKLHSNLKKVSNEGWLQVTSSGQRRLGAGQGQTLAAKLRESEFVPDGLNDSSLRRLARKQDRVLKRPAGAGALSLEVSRSMIDGSDSVRTLARPTPMTSLSYETDYGTPSAIGKGGTARSNTSSRRTVPDSSTVAETAASFSKASPKTPRAIPKASQRTLKSPVDIELSALADLARAKTDPSSNLPGVVSRRIPGLARVEGGGVPIPRNAHVKMAFDEPTYKKLQALNPEFFLPGFAGIPSNTLSLLAVNPKFIEAYLLGLNHEMSREFAWREYPALLNGTWFRRFWDYVDEPDTTDIAPVGAWSETSELGSHTFGFRPGEKVDQTVLLLKGDLLRLYPNTLIYAVKAEWREEDGTWFRDADVSKTGNVRLPIFEGKIGDEAHFLGFDLSADDMVGSSKERNRNAGWFLVFEEQMSEPRFGFDAADDFASAAPDLASELSWGHFADSPDALSAMVHAPLQPNWRRKKIEGVIWGKNSAQVARLAYQQPVRVCFHADALIEE